MKRITSRPHSGWHVPGDDSKDGPATPYEPVRIARRQALHSFCRTWLAIESSSCATSRRLSREHAAALSRFVDSGGTLIIMVGDRVGAGAYAALEEQKLLPGRIGDPVEVGSVPIRRVGQGSSHRGSVCRPVARRPESAAGSARSPGSLRCPRLA